MDVQSSHQTLCGGGGGGDAVERAGIPAAGTRKQLWICYPNLSGGPDVFRIEKCVADGKGGWIAAPQKAEEERNAAETLMEEEERDADVAGDKSADDMTADAKRRKKYVDGHTHDSAHEAQLQCNDESQVQEGEKTPPMHGDAEAADAIRAEPADDEESEIAEKEAGKDDIVQTENKDASP